jgi:hypothetical protein
MTFEQFQTTRKWTDDLGEAIGADFGEKVSGFVYAGNLHIIARAGGAYPDFYELIIYRDSTVSEHLENLERKLYDFGCEEGTF